MRAPQRRNLEVRVAPEKTSRAVIFSGRPLEVQF
jgi:hypothetical protein